jgi:hypothetical protein
MVLTIQLSTQAQIDQAKLDSLKRSIDASAKAHKLWQDSFAKVQESLYQNGIKTNLSKQKGLREQRDREAQRRKTLQGSIIALLVAMAALILVLRRKKKNT